MMIRKLGKKTEKKRFAIVALIIGLLFSVVVLICIIASKKEVMNDDDIVAWINDEPIAVGEFNIYFQRHKAATISLMKNTYGAEMTSDFWTKSFHGLDTPIQLAKDATLDELKRIKYEQILMKAYGVVKDISYSNFMMEFQNENKRRIKILKKGGIVYGPEQYTRNVYYEYLRSMGFNKLKQILEMEFLKQSSFIIEKKYDELKDSDLYLREPDTITVKKISIPYSSAKTKQEAEMTIKKVEKRIHDGEGWEKITRQFSEVKVNEEVFDGAHQQNDGRLGGSNLSVISNLKLNQVSEIVDWNHSLMMYKVIGKVKGGYKPLSDVKQYLAAKSASEKIDHLISEGMAHTKISINRPVYDLLSN
jgi:hypothetical protein